MSDDEMMDRLVRRLRKVNPDHEVHSIGEYEAFFFPSGCPEPAVRIPLTRGKFALIDKIDAPLVLTRSWAAAPRERGNWYAHTTRSNPSGTILLHRAILGTEALGVKVDHENRDGLDNRRRNLRLASSAQSSMNRRAHTRRDRGIPTSIYKGVSFDTNGVKKGSKKPWRVLIYANGKKFSLGCYVNPEEAARVYNDKAVELHGEFAVLNTIPEGTNDERNLAA